MAYQQQRAEFDNYYKDLQLHADEYLQGQCELVSAGFVNYLPELPIEQHVRLYKQVLLHKQLSVLEQAEREVLDLVQAEGEYETILARLRKEPAIICTMHTGSYRVVNLFLIQQHIPFTLVTGKAVLEKEGAAFKKIYQQLSDNEGEGLKLIDAEDARAGLQMLRTLKEGRSLVLYIDGHTGAGKTTQVNSNNCVVDFLAQQLYVRKGIAYLAHAAVVPIMPVVCYRKSMDELRLRFYAAIEPDLLQTRNDFAATTTQQLYTLFSEVIRCYPEQWEGWLTIHKTAKLVHIPNGLSEREQKKGENIQFDHLRFGIFKTGGTPFLLQKQRYLFYEIDEPLYRLLYACTAQPIDKKWATVELLTELLAKGIVYFV